MSAFLDKASRTSGFSRDLSPLPPIHQGVSTRSHTNVFSSQNLEDGHTQGSSYSLKGSVNGSLHVGSSTLKNANKHGHQGGNGAVKLTNVEAQRMMSVLTELQKKVVILGLLPDTIDRKTASMFHQETVTVMQVSLLLVRERVLIFVILTEHIIKYRNTKRLKDDITNYYTLLKKATTRKQPRLNWTNVLPTSDLRQKPSVAISSPTLPPSPNSVNLNPNAPTPSHVSRHFFGKSRLFSMNA